MTLSDDFKPVLYASCFTGYDKNLLIEANTTGDVA